MDPLAPLSIPGACIALTWHEYIKQQGTSITNAFQSEVRYSVRKKCRAYTDFIQWELIES